MWGRFTRCSLLMGYVATGDDSSGHRIKIYTDAKAIYLSKKTVENYVEKKQ